MKTTDYQNRRRRRGIAVITTTLALFTIIPLVGLAIDLTMLYLIRTRLMAASDAAVLAGARALSRGADAAAQRNSAREAATKFFHANWPAGYWGTNNLNFPTPVVDDTTHVNYRSVSVTASVDAPIFFLGVFGGDRSRVRVSAQAGRRDALVVLVLDRSSSMNRIVPPTGRTACAIMRDDAIEFVRHFAPGRDMVGLVVFHSGQFTYQARTNFTTPDASGNTVNSLIANIVCESNTASAEALRAAYQEVLRVNSSTRANVIVFMTDGIPNGVTGDFYPYRLGSCSSPATSPPRMIGVLAQWANNAPTGTTAGLMQRTLTGVTGAATASTEGTSNCTFMSNLTRIGQNVSRMPPSDFYGNALAGTYSTYSNPYVSFFGSAADLTRVDLPREITKASANAADNQATEIRSHPTLKPMIYTIGLNTDPTGGDAPDEQLLMKIANDSALATAPGAGPTFYNQQMNQPRGIYVNAPDATQLQSAFDTIATHIVIRLAR